jgi:uncharacterized membrane protein YeiH
MSDRKEPLRDLRVQAAIETLKKAVLAVNGDRDVKNVVILMDVRTQGGGGVVDLFMDVCPCEACLNRMTMVIAQGMADAEENRPGLRKAVH